MGSWQKKAMSLKRRIRQQGRHQIWTGRVHGDGYPIIMRGGKIVFVARLLWEKRHGEVPEGRRLRKRRELCTLAKCVAPGCRGLV